MKRRTLRQRAEAHAAGWMAPTHVLGKDGIRFRELNAWLSGYEAARRDVRKAKAEGPVNIHAGLLPSSAERARRPSVFKCQPFGLASQTEHDFGVRLNQCGRCGYVMPNTEQSDAPGYSTVHGQSNTEDDQARCGTEGCDGSCRVCRAL